jgi:hypothetical protein
LHFSGGSGARRRAGRPGPHPSRRSSGTRVARAPACGHRVGAGIDDCSPRGNGRIGPLSAIAQGTDDAIAMMLRWTDRRARSIRAESVQRREVETCRTCGGCVDLDASPSGRDREQQEEGRDLPDPCREAEPPMASPPHSPFLASHPEEGVSILGELMGDPMFQKSFVSPHRRKSPTCCRFATDPLRV